MSVGFYMDEHIHRAITSGLRLRGIDVLTVQEDGYNSYPDPIILDRATELKRLLFSQDQDFLVEANHRQSKNVQFSGLVFARQSMVSIGQCINDLELIGKLGNLEEFENQVQFLPL